jgi:hypothetical protein
MKRTFLFRIASFAALVTVGVVAGRIEGTSSAQPTAHTASAPQPAPSVPSVASLMDAGLHWGMSHAELVNAFNRPGGIFDGEYAPRLARMRPGTQMQMVEADLNNRRATLANSYVRFEDDPLGFDSTPIHPEYSYHNNEGMLWVRRLGTKQYFFFFGQAAGNSDRFWKIYDEVPLRAGGRLGATFEEATAKLSTAFGVRGRTLAAGTDTPEVGKLAATTVDWQDGTSHVRLIDRSDEHLVGVVMEESSTRARLAELRPNHPVDPFALDPSTAAVTQHGVSDPNAAHAAPSASASAHHH